MRRRTYLLPVLAALLCLVACAPASAGAGELQAFAHACDKANDGKRIAVEGYLRLPDSLTGGGNVELRLYRDLSFTGKPIGVNMRFGDGANQTRNINAPYHDDDLKVHLADGTLVPFGTKLRVSGRMDLPVVQQDFDCELQNVYVEQAK